MLMGWSGIIRLGLIQAAIGSLVVLATSTFNRIMVVELALPAVFPGLLVAIHYAVQMARTRVGHGSDNGGRLTNWIIGGMLVLAVGVIAAAASVGLMTVHRTAGILAAIAAYIVIGLGVGASGTSLLVLLAKTVTPQRRPAAATLTWLMMFVGFVMTTAIVSLLLDPWSPLRLLEVAAGCAAVDVLLTLLAVWRVESRVSQRDPAVAPAEKQPAPRSAFRAAFREVWQERLARHFTLFIFISMLAYSGQELLLEPFAGRVLDLTPGQSARIASLQHGGALIGMVLVAVLGSIRWRVKMDSLRNWTAWGCAGSAVALLALALCALTPAHWPLRTHMLVLGVMNGIFAVSAIGAMMQLVSASGPQRQGLRMGLWGAAQAVAFAMGGAVSSALVDVARYASGSAVTAYAIVFAVQAALFVVAARIAAGLSSASEPVSSREQQRASSEPADIFDVAVIGGGPAGATAAADLGRAGYRVLLLDKGGRIKPCGGAIPPRLIAEFEIPPALLVARVTCARMVSPASRQVDMAIDSGFVGMVNRESFDEWLRERARQQGCVRATGVFEDLNYEGGMATVRYRQSDGAAAGGQREIRARLVVGADGAQSAVARRCLSHIPRPPYVAAYHEILQRPPGTHTDYSDTRCDVFYQGKLSPDFYAWIFPHGDTLSIGVGSAHRGFSLRKAVTALREQTGLTQVGTVRCEGAPIPLRPLRRWDDGRGVVLAGDAAGVVAPASGEGIYYAMTGGRCAALAATEFLRTGNPATLRLARRRFMRAHGRVFFILGMLQRFWYSSDKRRESFVSICKDPDVQRLTWEAYLHKRLVRAQPMAHVRIFFKDLMHLMGVART
jgi:geranylgeranyl reductase